MLGTPVKKKSDFFKIKEKDKGVERGFFGYLVSELETKLEDLQNSCEDSTLKTLYEGLDRNSRFDLFVLAITQNLKDKSKITEIIQSYINFKIECEKNTKTKEKTSKIQKFFRLFNLERTAVNELAEKLKLFENGLFSVWNIGDNEYIRYFRNKHETIQRTVAKKDIIRLKPRYIIKGDRCEFMGLSLSSPSLKSLIRNIFENHFMDSAEANYDALTEFFALKFTEFLEGKTPESSFLVQDTYSDGSIKLMLASTLHDSFRDFEGLLIDSNTGEQQLVRRNYNRLIPNKGRVKIDDREIEIQDLVKNIMIFAILNDLDGIGAQGQNVGINPEGELLYFDFGHSLDNPVNLGASFIPQLGYGNVKSRNVASFFAGISLYEQLKFYDGIRQKFEKNGAFDNFIKTFGKQLEKLIEKIAVTRKETVFRTNGLVDKLRKDYLEILKAKVLTRIAYINKIFENRLKILEEQNGEMKINVLENLQLLIFRGQLTQYSANGFVLKEGTAYFDMIKKDDGTYEISLQGHSFYRKDAEYRRGFLTLIKEFRGHTKNPYNFSEAELIEFSQFLLRKKQLKISELEDKSIAKSVATRARKERKYVLKTTETQSYSHQRDVDAIRAMLKIKRVKIQEQTERIDLLSNRVRDYEANLLRTNRVVSDEEYAEANETIVLSEKLRRVGTTGRLNKKDIKKLRREITYTDVSQTIGSTCVQTTIGLKVSVEEKLINGNQCLEMTIEEDLREGKYNGYKIVIKNLGDYSKFSLIGNIRTFGLSKGLRKTSLLVQFSLLDNSNNHLKGKEYKEFLNRLNDVKEIESSRVIL